MFPVDRYRRFTNSSVYLISGSTFLDRSLAARSRHDHVRILLLIALRERRRSKSVMTTMMIIVMTPWSGVACQVSCIDTSTFLKHIRTSGGAVYCHLDTIRNATARSEPRHISERIISRLTSGTPSHDAAASGSRSVPSQVHVASNLKFTPS